MHDFLINIQIRRQFSELDILVKLIQDINGLHINFVLIIES